MANALLLVTGVVMLVLQGLVAYVGPSEYLAPVLVLPMVLYMSVGEFSLARGVSLSFVLGYLADVFAGGSIGEKGERVDHFPVVLPVVGNENINIFGGSDNAVEDHCPCADNQILGFLCIEQPADLKQRT